MYRKSALYRNIQPSPTSAAPASEFQSKVIFDEIEKQLKEVQFLFPFTLFAWQNVLVNHLSDVTAEWQEMCDS